MMARKKRNPKSVELANRIISEYAPETVEDIFFFSMDSVSGLEAGVKAIFPQGNKKRRIP